ncbi:retrograde regulation 2 protein [Rutstroemia sp. NJR-2017a WRK4]|nr:retrograde regulation 2 protein [Rutstroemia sp. NJR-2017a WRK4]PQE11714.1 retrograde regulation 2 protein [Rutstroemia sp. NJR-2017a WRK4]
MGGGPEFPLNASPRISQPPESEELIRHSKQSYLRAVVDMGSNGIRFSVSDLSPPTSRILPTLHVHRIDISLFDAQFDSGTGRRIPIPSPIIQAVIAAILRFQIICSDLGVPENSIRILATEATRTAINSREFREEVRTATGLIIEMLAKEDEGIVGALGIASSFSDMKGLVMDLGGGSTQISWMVVQEGIVRTSPKGAFSFPYGAAALTRMLQELTAGKSKNDARKAIARLREDMTNEFLDAYQKLEIPEWLVGEARSHGGFHIYLSGGGFRGWGYLLLYQSQVHGHHYPISLINGFSAQKSDFEDTEALKNVAKTAHHIFRVSDRRRAQVPAVAFLVNVLANALPYGIKEAHFCQGGVREGVLYLELPPNIRSQDPLEVATAPYARPSAAAIADLLLSAIPSPSRTDSKRFPASIGTYVLRALANVLYVHSVMSKETSSTAALYSTSTGLLSTSHGISHSDRALLALMLEERYWGVLPPRKVEFKSRLGQLLTAEAVWWTRYIGKIGFLVSTLYPAGFIDQNAPRAKLSATWKTTDLEQEVIDDGLKLTISIEKVKNDPMKLKEALEDAVGIITKVGKRKNWIGGRNGWGLSVEVVVEEDLRP